MPTTKNTLKPTDIDTGLIFSREKKLENYF
jgi:hypothetical protein